MNNGVSVVKSAPTTTAPVIPMRIVGFRPNLSLSVPPISAESPPNPIGSARNNAANSGVSSKTVSA